MKRVFLTAFLSLCVMAEISLAQTGSRPAVQKVCGKCKRVVPDDSKIGNRCPICGVKWADDADGGQPQEKAKPNIPSPTYQSHAWDRIAESESYTYTSFIWRWVVIGVGLVVSAIIVLYTVRFLKNNV